MSATSYTVAPNRSKDSFPTYWNQLPGVANVKIADDCGLFVAQGHHWIQLENPERRNEACEESNCREETRKAYQGPGIIIGYAVKKVARFG